MSPVQPGWRLNFLSHSASLQSALLATTAVTLSMSAEVASAPVMKAAKAGFEESPDNKSYPIRMTLSSTKMKAVEQGMWDNCTCALAPY